MLLSHRLPPRPPVKIAIQKTGTTYKSEFGQYLHGIMSYWVETSATRDITEMSLRRTR